VPGQLAAVHVVRLDRTARLVLRPVVLLIDVATPEGTAGGVSARAPDQAFCASLV
jgi:hypothetical protein